MGIKKTTCPSCRTLCTFGNLAKDPYGYRVYINSVAPCPLECGWHGALCDLAQHNSTCVNAKCTDCKDPIPFGNDSHEGNCIESCQYCFCTVQKSLAKVHQILFCKHFVPNKLQEPTSIHTFHLAPGSDGGSYYMVALNVKQMLMGSLEFDTPIQNLKFKVHASLTYQAKFFRLSFDLMNNEGIDMNLSFNWDFDVYKNDGVILALPRSSIRNKKVDIEKHIAQKSFDFAMSKMKDILFEEGTIHVKMRLRVNHVVFKGFGLGL